MGGGCGRREAGRVGCAQNGWRGRRDQPAAVNAELAVGERAAEGESIRVPHDKVRAAVSRGAADVAGVDEGAIGGEVSEENGCFIFIIVAVLND